MDALLLLVLACMMKVALDSYIYIYIYIYIYLQTFCNSNHTCKGSILCLPETEVIFNLIKVAKCCFVCGIMVYFGSYCCSHTLKLS